MKRKKYNKAKSIECKICNKPISSYHLSKHILKEHNTTVETYIQKYGEFRKRELQLYGGKRNIKKIICKICDNEYSITGLSNHLRDRHNATSEQYIQQYGEFRPKFIDYNARAEKNKITCLICKQIFGSERLLTYHIKSNHHLAKIEYIKNYVFNNQPQYCKCGCKREVKLLLQPPYSREYISGHDSKHKNIMTGKMHTISSKHKMSNKAIMRTGQIKKIGTTPERLFEQFLIKNSIKYIFQFPTAYGCVDFYLPEKDIYVEIDGTYWHPDIKENLNFQLISGAISEKRKSNLPNIIRIKETDLCKITSLDDLNKYNHHPELKIKYKQKLLTKEYLQYYKQQKGEDKLRSNVWLLRKFLREMHPQFPYPVLEEDLKDIVNVISQYDMSRCSHDNIFRTNVHSIGVNYLKSHFKSYWSSKYKIRHKTPIEAWYDDNILTKIIEYRIGLNNTGEVFDFNLHQMVKGLSANRYTISFFKPLLAASIYKKFIGNKEAPVVIDPCAGFGGRMLGFKSIYPNGTYIGIEPNIDTYNELVSLSRHFTNVKLYNCKLEEYRGNKQCDLTFTSIPYFDTEIYSKHIEYESFGKWKEQFIGSLLTFSNLLINLPQNLQEDLQIPIKDVYYIDKPKSHFQEEIKPELLLLI